MTTKVILPTADILKDFKFLEEVFAFYDNGAGLKALVRDMVLTADMADSADIRALVGTSVHDAFRRATASIGLMDKVMREYANSPEARLAFVTGDNLREHAVELAAENLYQTVLDMVSNLFMRLVYEISKQNWSWTGDDFIAHVDVLEEPSDDA